MKVVEQLLEASRRDRSLLTSNAELGDVAAQPRDLDFFLYAPDQAKAELAASFVTDNSYGRPLVEHFPENRLGSRWRLKVSIHAPATPEVACTLSAFMLVLGQLFSLEYDGWEADLVRAEE